MKMPTCGEVAVGHARDAEVGELPAVVAGVQHVGRLDVAVDDALAVRERPARSPDRARSARQRASGSRTRSSRSASDSPGRYSSTMNGAPMSSSTPTSKIVTIAGCDIFGGGLGLALEPLEERRAHAAALLLRRHDRLDRDDAIEQRIARLVDDAHRALADGLEDLVAADRAGGPPALPTSRSVPGGTHRRGDADFVRGASRRDVSSIARTRRSILQRTDASSRPP